MEQLARDYRSLSLEPSERVALDHTAKLTAAPWEIEAHDIERLRAHGFDDRAIHDLTCIAAYFAFVNRVADGLGVELEERFGEGREA